MKPIREFPGQELQWTRVKRWKRAFELHSGDEVLAMLYPQKGANSMIAVAADGHWAIKRRSFWNADIVITELTSQAEIAVVRRGRNKRLTFSESKGGSLLRLLSFIGYFFAGVFLTNSVPHLVIAVTGRRNLTPFGQNSSPVVNFLWSGINLASGYLLVRFADKRTVVSKVDSKAWQIPYEAGCLALSVFGVLYAWFTASQELRKEPK